MIITLFFLFFIPCISIQLQETSLVTLRTVVPPRSGGGNTAPTLYEPLILEEWNSNGLVQSWNPPCTLTGLSTETWTEGRLSPRFPWGDQIWFLCRNVPVNSSFATNPAPVASMYIGEDGVLGTWVEEPLYPNATNLLNILPYWDESQGLNIFYLLGGGTSSAPARPAQARIRVDAGAGQPPDAQGALLATSQGVTINQLRILNKTLYGVGLFAGSTGVPNPTIFQIGQENNLPTGTRNPVTNIPGFPLVLSVWTDPFSGVWWRTGINRTAYLARHDNADGSDLVYLLPPSSSAGTLGGASWSVLTGRQEGSDFAIYLTNTTHIVKNTYNGLQNGLPYQPVVQAPQGWRYLSAHARNPTIPSPTPTATATASSTASASASCSSTASSSGTASASPTASASSSSSSTASSSASSSASATSSSTATSSLNPLVSPSPSSSPTPTSSPSNASIPIPNNAALQPSGLTPAEATGVSVGSIIAVSIAAILLVKFNPVLQKLYIRQFGSSLKTVKRGASFKKPVSSDVPITINYNPQLLAQHRVEQLKQLQKQISMREANSPAQKTLDADRMKKEFGPTIVREQL